MTFNLLLKDKRMIPRLLVQFMLVCTILFTFASAVSEEICFDLDNIRSGVCEHINTTEVVEGCTAFADGLLCLADALNKSVEVCYNQILQLYRDNRQKSPTATTSYDALNCPCTDGNIRREGDTCNSSICQNTQHCQNVTDPLNITTSVCCLRPSILPNQSACHTSETIDATVQTDSVGDCERRCTGACRGGSNVTIPICCVENREEYNLEPGDDGEGEGLHGGLIFLIVLVALTVVALAIFGVLHLRRSHAIKKHQQQTQTNPNQALNDTTEKGTGNRGFDSIEQIQEDDTVV